MALFLQNCLAFPVIIFSGLLLIILFYWICAAFGLFDIDILNMDVDSFDATSLAGWLTKLGLTGIPDHTHYSDWLATELFQRALNVVLISYDATTNSYTVANEDEFRL
ncbi:hypothetical protein BDD26_0049 [Xenorhabdus cabanillasii]|uniref:Uncharacterized protein n=1 Tax=Xenorhabdus cabanillasii TaxID=351673 RepID=A0A3D9U7V9_9GAMM|nr:hypothetical protein [Xenorhabdus cabanillasii]REF25558.1 hypothetical protein BDD26_0049 [Xenorhabdus cabanillasii]